MKPNKTLQAVLMLICFADHFLELLDRFSVTIRQVGQKAGVCVSVSHFKQDMMWIHFLKTGIWERPRHSTSTSNTFVHQSSSNYHCHLQTYSTKRLVLGSVVSHTNSSRCSNVSNGDITNTQHSSLLKYWSTVLSIQVIEGLDLKSFTHTSHQNIQL